jgi:BlaI family penicillinase repressor
MPRIRSEQPTEIELTILNVLWERGSCTVREVHETLQKLRDTGYSTTLKMMQVMHKKGLLTRDDSQRPQVYRVAQPEKETQNQILDHLVQKVFQGSVGKLVLSAIQSQAISAGELKEIQQLLKDRKK